MVDGTEPPGAVGELQRVENHRTVLSLGHIKISDLEDDTLHIIETPLSLYLVQKETMKTFKVRHVATQTSTVTRPSENVPTAAKLEMVIKPNFRQNSKHAVCTHQSCTSLTQHTESRSRSRSGTEINQSEHSQITPCPESNTRSNFRPKSRSGTNINQSEHSEIIPCPESNTRSNFRPKSRSGTNINQSEHSEIILKGEGQGDALATAKTLTALCIEAIASYPTFLPSPQLETNPGGTDQSLGEPAPEHEEGIKPIEGSRRANVEPKDNEQEDTFLETGGATSSTSHSHREMSHLYHPQENDLTENIDHQKFLSALAEVTHIESVDIQKQDDLFLEHLARDERDDRPNQAIGLYQSLLVAESPTLEELQESRLPHSTRNSYEDAWVPVTPTLHDAYWAGMEGDLSQGQTEHILWSSQGHRQLNSSGLRVQHAGFGKLHHNHRETGKL